MIELQRQRLLAAGKGNRAAASVGVNGVVGGSKSGMQPLMHQTPQQKAAAAVRSEDQQLDHFIQRLVQRDDSRETSLRVPTVPTSLSRRMLNRQGAGFLDSTVAALVSAAGDRFLATVLHQAGACRDQRLKGAEVQREASLARKRHLDQVAADKDDRERRKYELAQQREMRDLRAIAAGEALESNHPSKPGEKAATDSATSPKSKKAKKKNDEPVINGARTPASAGGAIPAAKTNLGQHLWALDDDGELSADSMDEEEDYYHRYYGVEEIANTRNTKNDGDDEDEEALILRDLTHPLEAWGFDMTGKVGLLPSSALDDDDRNNNDSGERLENSDTALQGEGAGGDGLQDPTADEAENDDMDSEDDDDMDISTHPTTAATLAAPSSSGKKNATGAAAGDNSGSKTANEKKKSTSQANSNSTNSNSTSKPRNPNSPLPTT